MSFRTNMIANYAGQGWSALMGVVFLPVYVQLLGIEAFALVGFFTMLQMWLMVLDMGMGPTLSRETARFTAGALDAQELKDLLLSFEGIAYLVGILVACVIIWGAPYIGGEWLNAEQLSPATIARAIEIIGVVVALRLLEAIYRSALIGLNRQVWLNGANAFLATLRNGGAVIILLYVDRSVEAFFYWQGAIAVLSLVALRTKIRASIPRTSRRSRFSLDALRRVGRFAGGMIGINLLAICLLQADKIILSRLLPLDLFGYYMFATTLTGMMYTLIGPITQAVYPLLVTHCSQDRATALAETYHGASQLVCTVLAPVVLVLVLFPSELVLTWSGNAELAKATASLLPFLAIGTFLNGLMQMPYYLQLAHGWTSLALRGNLVSVLFIVPAIFWAVPRYGPLGAAAIWMILNIFYVTIMAPLMFRRLLSAEKREWYIRDIVMPIAAATAAALPVYLFFGETALSRLGQGVLLLATGGAAFVCAASTTTMGANLKLAVVSRFGRRGSV